MRAIETTAVFEDPVHLRLAEPISDAVTSQVKVILLWTEPLQSPDTWPPGFLDRTYGCCEDDPVEVPVELPFEQNRDSLE